MTHTRLLIAFYTTPLDDAIPEKINWVQKPREKKRIVNGFLATIRLSTIDRFDISSDVTLFPSDFKRVLQRICKVLRIFFLIFTSLFFSHSNIDVRDVFPFFLIS